MEQIAPESNNKMEPDTFGETVEDSQDVGSLRQSTSDTISRPGDKLAIYQRLPDFLQTDADIYSKLIDEGDYSNNRKSETNRFLCPRLAGMEDLSSKWSTDAHQLSIASSAAKARLWSFEVELVVGPTNLRQAYFQTVSNSTWANFGYLVTTKVFGGDTMNELRMLHGRHGVGLIRFDPSNPTSSRVLIPALERPKIDWIACSRIANESSAFRDYLTMVHQFYETGDARKEGWD